MSDDVPAVPGYEVGDLLGTGARGRVWRAVRSADGALCAVKILPRADPETARELVTLSRVRHEHLVELLEVVSTGDGIALVMPEVDGGTVADLASTRGILTPGEAVTIGVPVLQALAELHRHGAVHGDLAPGNVLLTMAGKPVLADLDAVRWPGEDGGAPAELLVGTAGFVAPEVQGGAVPGPAADVWAAGAMVRWLLGGQGEYDGPLAGVLALLTSIDPQARPDAAEAARLLYAACPAVPVRPAATRDPTAMLTHRLRGSFLADRQAVPGTRAEVRARAREAQRAGRRSRWHLGGRGRVLRAVGVAALLVLLAGCALVGLRWWQGAPPVAAARPSAVAPTTLSAAAPSSPSPTSAARPSAVAPTTPSAPAPSASAAVVAPPNPAPTAGAGEAGAQAGSDDPVVALSSLVDARARMLTSGDRAALDDVDAPGSPAAVADGEVLDELAAAGGHYDGLTFAVHAPSVVSATSERATVRAVVDRSGYVAQPSSDAVPPAAGTPLLVTLTKVAGQWRIAQVGAA